MKNYNTMLHMKLNSAVSIFAVAAAFAVFLPPSNASAGVCFLPDCNEKDLAGGGGNMNVNDDTKFCEDKGYTYYASGECPQYYAKVGECNRDDHYLKCDAKTWCEQNGYNTTSCSIPKYVDQPCPSYGSLYKQCKTDNQRACRDTGYTNSCPSGQKLKKNSGRCAYDSSYGTCCRPSGCPSYTSTNSSSYGTNGTDGCEYTCYYTCNMNCPSSYPYSSDPTGCSSRTTNGCGNKSCYNSVSCCNSSSSNWCSVHSTCHGDCCRDGTIQSCDARCGGSGCSSSSGGGSSGGSSSGSGSSGSSGSSVLDCTYGHGWTCSVSGPCVTYRPDCSSTPFKVPVACTYIISCN